MLEKLKEKLRSISLKNSTGPILAIFNISIWTVSLISSIIREHTFGTKQILYVCLIMAWLVVLQLHQSINLWKSIAGIYKDINEKHNNHSIEVEKKLRALVDYLINDTNDSKEEKYLFYDPHPGLAGCQERLPSRIHALVNALEGRSMTWSFASALLEAAVRENKLTQFQEYEWRMETTPNAILLHIGGPVLGEDRENWKEQWTWCIIKFTRSKEPVT